jgi:hypothetical protein
MPPRFLIILLALIATPLFAASAREVVREQRSFTVNGVREVWRLIWRGPPDESKSCGPAQLETAMTCPCSGAAYAQIGDLVLERQRPRMPLERLALTPLFAGAEMVSGEKGPVAMLARWPERFKDIGVNRPLSAKTIRARPAVPVMRLRDYDHDGIAGEFLLQVDTEPCGKHVMVAVGTMRGNSHLHALTSVDHPERPWRTMPGNGRPWPAIHTLAL